MNSGAIHRKITKKEHLKNNSMRLLEIQYGKSIETILSNGTLRELEEEYNIPFTTLGRWRRRLGIYMEVECCYGCKDVSENCKDDCSIGK